MAQMYISLKYEDYKELERQCKDFAALETSHKTDGSFYHRAFRLRLSDDLLIEFQGPLVMEPETYAPSDAWNNAIDDRVNKPAWPKPTGGSWPNGRCNSRYMIAQDESLWCELKVGHTEGHRHGEGMSLVKWGDDSPESIDRRNEKCNSCGFGTLTKVNDQWWRCNNCFMAAD